MKLSLVSSGPGDLSQMTCAALQAVSHADCLMGASRLLENFPEHRALQVPLALPEQIIEYLHTHPEFQTPCVLLSGDAGFYSGAKKLVEHFGAEQTEVYPGISSVSCFSARLGIPWQDWHLVSAHGTACEIAAHVANFEKTFALTGGAQTPDSLCRELDAAGFGECAAYVGQNLSSPQEAVFQGTVRELGKMRFAPLSVLLVMNPRACERKTASFGLPDGEFLRGDVPMTKSEVRSVVLSKLRLRETDTLWDIGAGTGSVSVEMALFARFGKVCAVECSDEGCSLIRQNAQRFGLYNLRLIQGMAPQACEGLPAPDAAFIGGSKGKLGEILSLLRQKNPAVRVCISAITLETACDSLKLLAEFGFEGIEAVQVSISKTKRAGRSNLLMANNPVFVISAAGRNDG
mgnify:FL=1